MLVPLTLKEQVIGVLVLTSSEEGCSPHHAAPAPAIANQAAIAMENAQLYEQVRSVTGSR